MTDDNVIKALMRCSRDGNCKDCPFWTNYSSDCIGKLIDELIRIIKRLLDKRSTLDAFDRRSPCDFCKHYHTSTIDKKPCSDCPASRKRSVRKQ
ncbi:MAG: hypothetical protein ACI4YB_01905 [Oscillospiraceae bacterium]